MFTSPQTVCKTAVTAYMICMSQGLFLQGHMYVFATNTPSPSWSEILTRYKSSPDSGQYRHKVLNWSWLTQKIFPLSYLTGLLSYLCGVSSTYWMSDRNAISRRISIMVQKSGDTRKITVFVEFRKKNVLKYISLVWDFRKEVKLLGKWEKHATTVCWGLAYISYTTCCKMDGCLVQYFPL